MATVSEPESVQSVTVVNPRPVMSGGVKRDREGNVRAKAPRPTAEVVRTAFTPMFEKFRDELDEHHDRRERIIKVSRDVTALSKKM